MIAPEAEDDSVAIGPEILGIGLDFLIFAPDSVLGVAGGVTVQVNLEIKFCIVAHAAERAQRHLPEIIVFWKSEDFLRKLEIFDFDQSVAAAAIFDYIKGVQVPVSVVINQLPGLNPAGMALRVSKGLIIKSDDKIFPQSLVNQPPVFGRNFLTGSTDENNPIIVRPLADSRFAFSVKSTDIRNTPLGFRYKPDDACLIYLLSPAHKFSRTKGSMYMGL